MLMFFGGVCYLETRESERMKVQKTILDLNVTSNTA